MSQVTLNISGVIVGKRKIQRSISAPKAMVEKDGASKVALEYLRHEGQKDLDQLVDFKVTVMEPAEKP